MEGGWTDPGGLTRSRGIQKTHMDGETQKRDDEEYGGGRGGGEETVSVCSPSVSELRNDPERGSFKPWALLKSMSGLSRASSMCKQQTQFPVIPFKIKRHWRTKTF